MKAKKRLKKRITLVWQETSKNCIFFALQGRRLSAGLLKIWKENRIDDIIAYIRTAKDRKECIQKISTEFNVTEEISESIVDMSLRQIAGIEIDALVESQKYYEKAVSCLKPLRDMQRDSAFQ